MPGKAPVLKTKVKAMLRRQEALSLVGQGWPITKISEHMGTAVQSVRRLLRQALATDSLFPSSLTPERVSELRVLEAERLAVSTQKVVVAQNNALRRLKADNPKVAADAEMSIYRAHEALTRSCERLARLFGLDQPTKIVEEQTRRSLNVNVHHTEKGTMLTWDRSILTKHIGPVPGLTIYEGCRTNGVVPTGALTGASNGEVADGPPTAPTNDFSNNGDTEN